MTSYIKKRDSRIEEFNKQKIIEAVKKAFIAVDNTLTKAGVNIARRIGKEIEQEVVSTKEIYSVEDIQNKVEEKLMNCSRKDVARAYIIYRNDRTQHRMKNTQLMQEISKKIMATDVQNQNANVDEHSFGGRAGEARDELLKQYALNNIMSDLSRENHLNNEIYVHDLSSYALGDHNCLTVPFDDLLAQGFNTRQTDVRPANSINTAFQLVAVIFQLQSLQQFGGVSASHLDWTMVPYVRKSFLKHYNKGMKYIYDIDQPKEFPIPKYTSYPRKKFTDYLVGMPIDSECFEEYPRAYCFALEETKKELKQAVEGMYHNLSNWVA